MKTFLVGCTATRDFIVEAETPDKAIDIASNEYHGGFDYEVQEFSVEAEMTDKRKIDAAKRNGAIDIYDA